MELALPRDGSNEPMFASVRKWLRDNAGNLIGTANNNLILNTQMFDVEFKDSYHKSIAANLIAENLFAQVDSKGP
jgi:hypothetical protein